MTKQEQAAHINAQVRKGLVVAYNNMLAFKHYKQTPVIISRNGKVAEVQADRMPPAEDPAA
ncbi:hypothetical protein [Hymenobacter algoricola]|uniref:Uncharacterized protein n=1 Tax=Hymenobacter algoricola TaxID=486267 RepID=A0ABP7NG88_9BACT